MVSNLIKPAGQGSPWSTVFEIFMMRTQTKVNNRLSDRQKLAICQLADNEQTEIISSFLYGDR